MTVLKSDFDSPWKEILDVYFKDFVAYCWPYKFTQIDWVLALPAELELEYHEAIERYETEDLKMAYITTAERIGIEKGRVLGIEQGESALLLRQLTRKFKQVPDNYCEKIQKANSEMLLHWGERIVDRDTLEEIFAE